MTLCRRDLEEGRMRALYMAAVAPGHALSDKALEASLQKTLAQKPEGAGWWVFAYGSLLWNPLFPFAESQPARVQGLHRRFCLQSLASRGTADKPGLVLGLEQGGCCRGVLYRLPANQAMAELRLLWRREMVVGSYHPRWLLARPETPHGRRSLHALSFVVDRKHPQYVGWLTLDEQIAVLASASGVFGSSADYLEHARTALITHGIIDPYLERLAQGVASVGHGRRTGDSRR
jgi:cation transport protein ChaC